MKKLVLIGNGFDLAHGLKTSYKDFILWYVNKMITNLIRADIYKDFHSDDLITISRGQYHGGLRLLDDKNTWFNNIKDFLEAKKGSIIKVDYKNTFFQKIVEESIENWVDIEANYYSTLIDFYRMSDEYDKPHSAGKEQRQKNIHTEVQKLNFCFDQIKNQLTEYLLGIDKQNKEKNEEINSYFETEFKSISSGKLHYLNFNYTSTVELYTERHLINYIHGRLDDDKNPLIFGYGDEIDEHYEKIERLNNNEFLKNIKSFGYFKTKSYQKLSGFMNGTDRFDVCIMGHSCGISDRLLLNHIFEHENCKRIKIYYYQKSELNDDYFEKTQEISRHFKGTNKTKMRDRILIHSECVPLTKYKPK